MTIDTAFNRRVHDGGETTQFYIFPRAMDQRAKVNLTLQLLASEASGQMRASASRKTTIVIQTKVWLELLL